MKIITGVLAPTSGTVRLESGRRGETSFNTNLAKESGIACAYQELSLLPNLKVYENFMINLMDHRPFGRPGWRRRGRLLAKEHLDRVFPTTASTSEQQSATCPFRSAR